MGLWDLVAGYRCDSCGQRGDTVAPFTDGGRRLQLCAKDRKAMRRADRSAPPGAAKSGYKAGSGRPVPLAGPMGSRYRGPEPPAQRRR